MRQRRPAIALIAALTKALTNRTCSPVAVLTNRRSVHKQARRRPTTGIESTRLVSIVEVIIMSEHTTTSRHLTVADICAELGISKSTFYDWRAARKAPCCIKLPNGGLRVRRADLERWLESREGQ